jgi:acyl-CoA synthetase (NDP forming)
LKACPTRRIFLAAARRAYENGKTVLAIKIGASEAARGFALAHTGSLAGSTAAFEAVAATAGVVRLVSIEDAIEAVELVARCRPPRGPNIAAVTNSGALRNLITEAAERTGATLATLSEATRSALSEALKQNDITNPLDTKRTIATSQYAACLDALVNAPEVDVVLTAEELPRDDGAERRVANLRALETIAQRAATLGKPVATFTPFITSATAYGRTVRAQILSVPVMRDIDRTLRIMRALAQRRVRLERAPAGENDLARVLRQRAAGLDKPTALNEVESKSLLRAYGIPLPQEYLVGSWREAIEAAHRIGFPVVLKGVCAAIPHKSDAGLVRLDCRDEDTVKAAYVELTAQAGKLGTNLDGILVAQQITRGTECVLGISRDPEMGPVVMFGLGGILVEIIKDVSFGAPGLDRDEALAMVKATRAARLLDGFRGSRPGDLAALLDALVDLGRLAQELPDVIEAIDINPFLVCERGAFALDGLVVLRPPDAAASGAPRRN